MAFERLLRLTKKCPGYVVSGLRNASWYSNCHSRVVRKPILHNLGSFWHPVTFCHDNNIVTNHGNVESLLWLIYSTLKHNTLTKWHWLYALVQVTTIKPCYSHMHGLLCPGASNHDQTATV